MGQMNTGVFSPLIARKIQVRAIGKALSVSVLNQVVSSGTNFVLGLYLVRTLTPAEFGLYSIGFAISLFYAGIGNALFLTQMVVHTPDKVLEDRLPYAARMLVLVAIFCATTVLLAGLILLSGGLLWAPVAEYTSLGLAITAASVAYLLKDFFVRHAYNTRKEAQALAINLILAAGLVLSLASLHFADLRFNAELALVVYALAHGLAAVFGIMNARLPIRLGAPAQFRDDLVEAWIYGKWALTQNLVYWLRTQAHTYISIILAGPAAVGLINATRLLISPILFLIPAISQIMLPRLAALRDEKRRVFRFTAVSATTMLALSLLYSLSLLLYIEPVMHMVLGNKYAEHPFATTLTIIWCFVMCVRVVQTSLGSLAQALKKFRNWTYANFFAAIVAVVFAGLFSIYVGIPGAVLGTLAGEIVLLTVMWRYLRRG